MTKIKIKSQVKVIANAAFNGSVVYQIYPRSFKDTDSNGVGDLAGVTEKLSYLKWLGVDVIWLTPVYSSPMVDFGYDVSDYESIDPLFGDMHEVNHLITKAHQNGIKIFMDFVPNHTSDMHKWFLESKSSRLNPKRDWYVWRSPKADTGSAPNNWLSVFGGSAWQYDESTKQYYLHTFLKNQPDLNWHNPEVRNAMKRVMRFWLNKGADGFRVDAVYFLAKDKQFRNDPVNPNFIPGVTNPYDSLTHTYSRKQPQLYDYLKELSDVVSDYPNRFLVTEVTPENGSSTEQYIKFYEYINPQTLAPFNFDGLGLPWKAKAFKAYVDGYQAALKLDYLPVYVLGNHDKPRLASRVGPEAARAAAVMLLTLPGMPFIYYGDEIGLQNVYPKSSQAQDQVEDAPDSNLGRDPERSPMQWSAKPQAGFSSVLPWLPISKKYKQDNVATQMKDADSILNLYRKLISLRRSNEAIKIGNYKPYESEQNHVFAYTREFNNQSVGVVINFSKTKKAKLPWAGKTLISTHVVHSELNLMPLEARVIDLSC